MEGQMPSMVENRGADESQVGDRLGTVESEVDVRNELNQRQSTEKLEKSEAGRKKLRQAIVLLKEKLDATSNALEVNETLRREVKKERLNVDTEKKRAEAERVFREKVENENMTIKEQFYGVFQRLDSLESCFKADRVELGRIRSEVKEAVGCIDAALQVIETTKGLYQSLERSVHAKVNGAVQSSSKALVIAQSGQATTSRAQAAALGAQSVAKAVQKEMQLLSSQVVTLQKQASNLTTLEASLQQDSQFRGLGTSFNSPDSGEANDSLAVSKEKILIDATFPRCSAVPPLATVICKNQTEVHESSQAKDVSSQTDLLNMLVASSENPRSNLVGSTVGLPRRGGMFLSRNQILDERLKPQTSMPQIRPGVRSPSNGLLEVVSKDEFTSNGSSSQPVSSSIKKGPVATIIGLDTVLSPAVRIPALLGACTKSLASARGNGLQKQGEVQPQRFSVISKGLESREFSNKCRVMKRGQGGLDRKHNSSTFAQNENCPSHVEADVIFSEGMLLPDSDPCPSSMTRLLESIIKMFEKEGKHRRRMEEKLMKLRGGLEIHGGPAQEAQTGMKRKRKPREGKVIGGLEKGKKRHLLGEMSKKMSDYGLNNAVASFNQRSCTTEDKCILQEKEVHQNDTQWSGDGLSAQDRLSKMISNLQGRCRGDGLFESTVDCQEVTHVRRTDECKDSYDVDICNDDFSKGGTGTNTDLEGTDDDLGEDWWAKRVLLSPIPNNDLTS